MPMTLSRALKQGRALSPVRGNAMHEVSVAACALFARHCACTSEAANGGTRLRPNHPWRHLAGETLPGCPPSSSESIPGLPYWSSRSRTSSRCWIVSVAPHTHDFRTRDAGPIWDTESIHMVSVSTWSHCNVRGGFETAIAGTRTPIRIDKMCQE